MTGTVKWYDKDKGYGFLTTDSDGEVFVHAKAIRAESLLLKVLYPGDAVEFNVNVTDRGKRAECLYVTKRAGKCPSLTLGD